MRRTPGTRPSSAAAGHGLSAESGRGRRRTPGPSGRERADPRPQLRALLAAVHVARAPGPPLNPPADRLPIARGGGRMAGNCQDGVTRRAESAGSRVEGRAAGVEASGDEGRRQWRRCGCKQVRGRTRRVMPAARSARRPGRGSRGVGRATRRRDQVINGRGYGGNHGPAGQDAAGLWNEAATSATGMGGAAPEGSTSGRRRSFRPEKEKSKLPSAVLVRGNVDQRTRSSPLRRATLYGHRGTAGQPRAPSKPSDGRVVDVAERTDIG